MEMPDEIAGRKVILWALVGSRGCGLATEDSDEDRFALVSPLFEDLYRGNMYHKQTVTLTEDVDVHDVRRLPDLLWKSSPVMLSVLFSPEILVPDTFAAPCIYRILEMRDSIASMNLPRLWSATMGAFDGMMSRLERDTESAAFMIEKYGYNTKQAMHALRSLMILRRFADTEFTDFGYSISADPATRELLLSVKRGRFTLEEFNAVVEEELARTKALEPLYKSAEPDTGPRDIVDQEILKLTRASVFESDRKTS